MTCFAAFRATRCAKNSIKKKEKFMTDSPKADAAVVPAATVAFAAPAADTAVKK